MVGGSSSRVGEASGGEMGGGRNFFASLKFIGNLIPLTSFAESLTIHHFVFLLSINDIWYAATVYPDNKHDFTETPTTRLAFKY